MNTATKVGSPIKCGQSSNDVIICRINSFEPKTPTAVMLGFFLFCQICMMSMEGDFLGVVISTALVLNTASSPNCSSNVVSDEQLIRGKLFFKGKGWK